MYVNIDVHICKCHTKAVHIVLGVNNICRAVVPNASVTSYFQYFKLGYNIYE